MSATWWLLVANTVAVALLVIAVGVNVVTFLSLSGWWMLPVFVVAAVVIGQIRRPHRGN